MKIFGLCLNWKVIGGLAAVGAAVWIVAPSLFAGAAPVLLALACPLSMVVMMAGMRGSGAMDREEHAGTLTTAAANGVPTQQLRVLSAEEELAGLRAELATVQARQDTIAARMATLAAALPQAQLQQTPHPSRSSRPSSASLVAAESPAAAPADEVATLAGGRR